MDKRKIYIDEFSAPLRIQLCGAGMPLDEAEKYQQKLNTINGLRLLGFYSDAKVKRKKIRLAKAIESQLDVKVILGSM